MITVQEEGDVDIYDIFLMQLSTAPISFIRENRWNTYSSGIPSNLCQ